MILYKKVNSHFLIKTTFGTFTVPNYGFHSLNRFAAIFILARFLNVSADFVNEAVKKSWDEKTFRKNLILKKLLEL